VRYALHFVKASLLISRVTSCASSFVCECARVWFVRFAARLYPYTQIMVVLPTESVAGVGEGKILAGRLELDQKCLLEILVQKRHLRR